MFKDEYQAMTTGSLGKYNLFKNERRRKMKEKRTKKESKESNKEEAKKEGHTGLDFAPLQQASPSEDLKINWEAFIRFFNATLKLHGSNIRPIAYLSKGKKSRVQSLVNHWNTKQALVDAVVSMARSDFLNGRKKGYPFIASFIWLTESDDHFDELLIERNARGAIWLHFAVRPTRNRRNLRFIS
jgi:hypothetical protein